MPANPPRVYTSNLTRRPCPRVPRPRGAHPDWRGDIQAVTTLLMDGLWADFDSMIFKFTFDRESGPGALSELHCGAPRSQLLVIKFSFFKFERSLE